MFLWPDIWLYKWIVYCDIDSQMWGKSHMTKQNISDLGHFCLESEGYAVLRTLLVPGTFFNQKNALLSPIQIVQLLRSRHDTWGGGDYANAWYHRYHQITPIIVNILFFHKCKNVKGYQCFIKYFQVFNVLFDVSMSIKSKCHKCKCKSLWLFMTFMCKNCL